MIVVFPTYFLEPSSSKVLAYRTVGDSFGVLDGLTTKRFPFVYVRGIIGDWDEKDSPDRDGGAAKGERASGVVESSSLGNRRAPGNSVTIAAVC